MTSKINYASVTASNALDCEISDAIIDYREDGEYAPDEVLKPILLEWFSYCGVVKLINENNITTADVGKKFHQMNFYMKSGFYICCPEKITFDTLTQVCLVTLFNEARRCSGNEKLSDSILKLKVLVGMLNRGEVKLSFKKGGYRVDIDGDLRKKLRKIFRKVGFSLDMLAR